MKQKGHWFCDNCDDVVFLTYEKTSQANIVCPDCGHLSCNFVPNKINRATLGEYWFAAMRRIVNESSTPELPTQNDQL